MPPPAAVVAPGQGTAASSVSYISGLDTIRGISMVLVLLTHLHLVGAGWVTIQTFFVMSGFLITRILLQLRDKHGFGNYLKLFYARRTLRIFPIFYACLLACYIAGFFWTDLAADRDQLGWVALYLWNWYAIFEEGAKAHYLEHFWSLAVEEQFYLLWPFAVYFLRGRRFWIACVAMVLAGPLLRFVSVELWVAFAPGINDPYKALYQMSTTHLDAFALGALMCVVVQQPWSRAIRVWHWFAFVLVAYLAGAAVNGWGLRPGGPYYLPLFLGYPIHLPNGYQYLWGYSVLNLASAGLLLLVVQGRFWTAFFNHGLLSRLGVITYGAYVLHLPILHVSVPAVQWLREAVASDYVALWLAAPVLLLLTFVLAELSFRYFEGPLLRLKGRLFPT